MSRLLDGILDRFFVDVGNRDHLAATLDAWVTNEAQPPQAEQRNPGRDSSGSSSSTRTCHRQRAANDSSGPIAPCFGRWSWMAFHAS